MTDKLLTVRWEDLSCNCNDRYVTLDEEKRCSNGKDCTPENCPLVREVEE